MASINIRVIAWQVSLAPIAEQRSIHVRAIHVEMAVRSCLSDFELESGVVLTLATCANNVASFSCICPAGWTGTLCENDIDECQLSLICHPNATCINSLGSYRCVCPSWLTGPNCYTSIDLCTSSPCQNNGVRTFNYGGSITCRCQTGFTGLFCEVNDPSSSMSLHITVSHSIDKHQRLSTGSLSE